MNLSSERAEQKAADAVKRAGPAIVITMDRRVVEMILKLIQQQRAEIERLRREMAAERGEIERFS